MLIKHAQKEALKQINTTFKLSEIGYGQGFHEGQMQERKYWQDKIKAKIGKRMQKNNNTIHNAKLKHGKDYVYYDDVQEAKEENRICKEILQSLLEKE